jgi:DNA-binding HxlR family transcriptional regulator
MKKGKTSTVAADARKVGSSAGKATCPITKTAELLSDTWTILIMRALTESPKRFVELERWLDGISSRTLTLKLQKLSREGMLEKSKDGVYTATDKGKGIRIIEAAMVRYSEKFLSSHKA